MITTKVSRALLGLIAEALRHVPDNEDKVELYEDEVEKVGLSRQEWEYGFKKLTSDGVVLQKSVMFAANSTQATNPMQAHLTSAKSATYGRVVYVLKVNRRKIKSGSLTSIPQIFYNSKTGIGFVNNERFKFKDDQPEFAVLRELYDKISDTLPKEQVLRLSNYTNEENVSGDTLRKNSHRKPASRVSQTYFINELVKKIRKMTGLSPDQLVNNNGNLTLIGEKLEVPSD